MHRNRKGFSAIEALLIAVVIGLIGVGGWYVWDKKKADKDSSKVSNDSSQQASERTPSNPNYGLFSHNDDVSFSFEYLKDWKIADEGKIPVSGPVYSSGEGWGVSVESLDYALKDEEIASGVRISVFYAKLAKATKIDELAITSISSGEPVKLSISGEDARQYTEEPQGSEYLTTKFIHNGYIFEINQFYSTSSTSKYLDKYNDIIKSFRFD